MSDPASITPIVLDTLIGHLAPHFLGSTNGDMPAARHAAGRLLAAYNAETEEELRLAADIVSFGFHSLEALAEAAAPDMSLNRKLRLRGSAVSLSRQAHKAQRKLDQLQRLRRAPAKQPDQAAISQTPAPVADPSPVPARNPVPDRVVVQAATMSRQQRRAAERLARKRERQNIEQCRRGAAGIAGNLLAKVEGAFQQVVI